MDKFIFDLQLFEDTGSSNITTFEALKTALEDTSATDIKITKAIEVPNGVTDIDLKGKIITVNVDGALTFKNAGTYTVKNGTLKTESSGSYNGSVVIWVDGSANVNLNLDETLTINSEGGAFGPCFYNSGTNKDNIFNISATLSSKLGQTVDFPGAGTINIKNGANISSGSTNGQYNTVYVADSNSVKNQTRTLNIEGGKISTENTSVYYAVNVGDGSTLSMTGGEVVSKNYAICLLTGAKGTISGGTVTGSDNLAGVVVYSNSGNTSQGNGGKLAVKGSAVIEGGSAIMVYNDGEVTVEGGTLKGTTVAAVSDMGASYVKGTAKINGGNLNSDGNSVLNLTNTNSVTEVTGGEFVGNGTVTTKRSAATDITVNGVKITTTTSNTTGATVTSAKGKVTKIEGLASGDTVITDDGLTITGGEGATNATVGWANDSGITIGNKLEVTGETIAFANKTFVVSATAGHVATINGVAYMAGSATTDNLKIAFDETGKLKSLGSDVLMTLAGTKSMQLGGASIYNESGASNTSVFVASVEGGFKYGSASNAVGKVFAVFEDTAYNVTLGAGDSNTVSGIGAGAGVYGSGLKNGYVVTDAVGTFKIGSASTASSFQTFTTANDSSVTFGLGSDTKVSAISDLASGTVAGALKGFTINDQTLTIEPNAEADVVSIGAGSNGSLTAIGGLSGTITKDFSTAFAVDGETILISGDTSVKVTANGKQVTKIEDIGAVANVASVGSATELVTESGKFASGDNITIAGNAYTVKDADSMTFGLKSGTVTAVGGLATTSDTAYGDFTNITSANGGVISIKGDKTVEIVGSASNNVVSALNSVSGSATLAGDALKGAKINTDATGDLTIGKATYKIAGDSTVTFAMDSNSATVVTSITNFDAAGTISGALNGVKFNNASASVAVSKDTDFAVVNDGSALYLANISDGAVVANSGEMNKVVTDTEGKYTIGTAADKFTISGDSSIEFALSSNAVTGITSLDGAAVLTASNKEISLNDTAVTLGAENNYTVSFASGKIGTVSGASLVSGVENALIVETTAAQIGTTAVNITGDKNYGISVLSGDAIGEISSISGGATVTGLANATLKTDSNGTFTFGTTGYDVAGDTEVQFVTGADSLLSAVTGLEGTVKTTDKEITINDDAVTVGGMNADSVVIYEGGTAGIAAITGLTNGAVVEGATSAALNLVGTTSTSVATSLTANGKLFQLLNDSDGVTITGGEVVTGLGSGASLVASNAGTYTVNGTVLNVAAGETIRGTSEGTAEIYDPSNVAEVNESVAAAVESLASAIINTEDYEDLSKDTTKLAEVTEAINSTSASADKSALNGDMKFAVSVPSGSNSQDVDLSANTGKKDVTLTTGNQSLKFNNEGGNVAEIGKDATGEKTVELGNGGDVVAIAKGADKKATINITAGTGPDTVVSGANASVDVGKGGATKVRAVGGATVTMNNYSAADSKAGVQTTNSDIAAAIGNGNITLENGVVGTSEGKVALNSGSSSADVVTSADSGDTEGSTIANLYNNAGKMTKVGFTHNDGGTVDLSGQKANTVIQGNNAATNKSGESTLLGGSGNDTIFAGSGDAIDAGAGANTIVLKDASSRSSDAEKGATIAMTSATGRNKVQNFNTGFEDGKDAISVDLTNAKFSIDGDGNLIVKNGRAKTTVESAASTSGDVSADATDGVANVLITDSSTGTTTKTAVAGEGKTIVVSNDEESFANSYIGDGSGLNFGSYESEVNLNLAGTTATFGGEDVEVSGINNVKLGEADATVFGSSAKETITAGSGNETIWAGTGKDTLNGYSGSADDKSGSITFGFIEGDGKDVINNFGYLTTENAQTADRVWTTGQFEAALSGNDVVLSFSGNKKDSLRITDAKGQNIQLSENGDLNNVTTVLQVSDTLLTYDGLATKYIATGSNAAVVASSLASSANIWLEDKYVNLSNNTTYTGKITAINAAAVEGSATLVGNSYNNVITGAQGSSSMWGGDSTSNDTLIGGSEGNMFFYGVTGGNEGNDSISGVTEDDTVNLFGIQLNDISDFDITNSTIALKFSAGGSLTMGNNGQTFMLSNDQNQRYTYDKENSEWTKA